MKILFVLFASALGLFAQDAPVTTAARSAEAAIELPTPSVQPAPCALSVRRPIKKAAVLPSAPVRAIPAEWVLWLAIYGAAMATLCFLLILALVARGDRHPQVVALQQPAPAPQPLIQPAMIEAPRRLDPR